MAEYIDREQAIKVAIDAVDDWDGGGNRFRAMIIKQAICEVPSADVRENVHGEWVEYPITDDCYQCSVCGVLRMGKSNFCPNCGARLDGKCAN